MLTQLIDPKNNELHLEHDRKSNTTLRIIYFLNLEKRFSVSHSDSILHRTLVKTDDPEFSK